MNFFKLLAMAVLLCVGAAVFLNARDAGLWVLNTGISWSTKATPQTNLAFGQKPWQTLDVYAQPTKSPVVVFIHGGAWYTGSKEQYMFAADAFFRLGYTVVVPDYIKFPDGRFPQFIEDGARAIKWTHQHIESFNGDPTSLFIVGHSAGAHTAALLVTDESYLQKEGLSPSIISAFAGIAGPYNFTPEWPQYIETFGKENFQRMKANTHVNGNEVPTFLLHAKGDDQVGQFNMDQLKSALKKHDILVETTLYPSTIGHISIVLKLHPWFADQHLVSHDIDQFFQRQAAVKLIRSEVALPGN